MLRLGPVGAHVANPHRYALHPILAGIQVTQILAKYLADRVVALRPGQHIDRTRHLLRIRGQQARPACKDHAPHVAQTRRLEEIVRPDDIAVQNLLPGRRSQRVPSQVNDRLHSLRRAGNGGKVGQLPHNAVLKLRLRLAVKSSQLVAALQPCRQHSAHRARCSRNQNPHTFVPRERRRARTPAASSLLRKTDSCRRRVSLHRSAVPPAPRQPFPLMATLQPATPLSSAGCAASRVPQRTCETRRLRAS